MKKLRLYLAHPLDERKTIREIELRLEKKYNIELVNPFYDSYRKDITDLDNGIITRHDFTKSQSIRISNKDLSILNSCDGILVYQPYNTIGSILELGHTHVLKTFGIKMITIIIGIPKITNHLWIKAYCDYRFNSFKKFETFLKRSGYELNPKNSKVKITKLKLKDVKNIKDINHLKLLKELNK